MNTPAHVLLNLTLLTGGRQRVDARPVLIGALLPDLPMLAFYVWERIVLGASEARIWGERYFDPRWQDFFDVFNSLPAIAVVLAFGLMRSPFLAWLALSMGLHVVLDLPFHHDDAHRHLVPFSDWRFESPISYWDPAHHGSLFLVFETALVVASSYVLWRRFPARGSRAALAAAAGLYATATVAFAWP